MTPQSEAPNATQQPDESHLPPKGHFLYISPETRAKVDARTQAAIAQARQQRAARVLREQQSQDSSNG
jgi:hypothetical protein